MVVTDRDLALMNIIKIVFPKSRNLLCQFYIDKNVTQETVMDYPIKFEYEDCLTKFDFICQPCHEFVVYVKDT